MTKDEYKLNQAKWAAKNSIHNGSKVKLVRAAKSRECGWNNTWEDTMDEYVGMIGTVVYTEDHDDSFGIEVEFYDKFIWDIPYFVLELVEKPQEPSYKPSYKDIANFLASCLSGTGNCPMGPDHKCPHIRGYLCLDKTKHPECWIEAVKKEFKKRKER